MDTEPRSKKRDTMSKLTFLRDDVSDEIPTEMITSISPNNRYKVRKAWWQGVIAALENALSEGLVSSENKDSVEQFVDSEFERLHLEAKTDPRKRVTAEDLDRANNILDLVLGRKK